MEKSHLRVPSNGPWFGIETGLFEILKAAIASIKKGNLFAPQTASSLLTFWACFSGGN